MIKRRCIRCLTILRKADGTCPNEECPKYVPDVEPDVKSDEEKSN